MARYGTIGYLSQEAALHQLGGRAGHRPRARPDRALDRRAGAADGGGPTCDESDSGAERDRLIARFSRLDDEFTAAGGYVAIAEAKRFASSLGIGADELDQLVVTMSGGQRRRVELARILFAETDTLLLDEPTNHLDLDAKAWLMEFLATYQGGLLVISHDLAPARQGDHLRAGGGGGRGRAVPRHLQLLHGRARGAPRSNAFGSASTRMRTSPGWRRVSAASRVTPRSWRSGPDPGRHGSSKLKEQRVEVGGGPGAVTVRFPQPPRPGGPPSAGTGWARRSGTTSCSSTSTWRWSGESG